MEFFPSFALNPDIESQHSPIPHPAMVPTDVSVVTARRSRPLLHPAYAVLVFALFGPGVPSSLRERRRTVAGRASQRAPVTPATLIRRLDATPGPHVLQ